MGIVHGKLKERNLPNKLFLLERSTSNAIERFKNDKHGVLFASGALWEGIDIPGAALSMLVIVKLPFAVPDAIAEHTREQYIDFYEYRDRILVPEMLIKLKQGFGRLIRTETDTGVVAILDSRANSHGAYRERVLNALPDCPVTSDINEVTDFFKAKKKPRYFQ
jgi:ATP-dependent DNA helicase DinG